MFVQNGTLGTGKIAHFPFNYEPNCYLLSTNFWVAEGFLFGSSMFQESASELIMSPSRFSLTFSRSLPFGFITLLVKSVITATNYQNDRQLTISSFY